MPEFQYIARDSAGRQHSGTAPAQTQDELIRNLRAQGLLTMEVKLLKQKTGAAISLNPFDYRSIRATDLEYSFHQLSMMLHSGMALLEALAITAEFSRPGARKTWVELGERIQNGEGLSTAMAGHKVFSQMTMQLVRVGEHTGNLDQALVLASEHLEKRRLLRSQLIQALSYPIFVILFAIGITIFMLVKLIPELKKFIGIMGRKLPPITQALIDTSNWINANLPGITAVLATISVTLFLLYQWTPARLWMDRAMLHIPLLGTLFRLSGTAVFARGLGTMLHSGVWLIDALQTMENLLGNRYLALCVANARERVAQGSSLSAPLMESGAFMPILPRMIAVGESSGKVDDILAEMARYHEDLLERAIKRMVGIIGPVTTILIGGLIGFVYAAFLTAMFAAAGGSPHK